MSNEEMTHVIVTIYRSASEMKRLPQGSKRELPNKRAHLNSQSVTRGVFGGKMDTYVREQIALGREVLLTPDF